jgi:hypothetical protein
MVLAVVQYRFDIEFLYELDIFGFDHLISLASKAYNQDTLTKATATRYAMNADQEQWSMYADSLTKDPKQVEAERFEKNAKALARMFGGGK